MSIFSTNETVNPELGIPSYLDVFEQVGGSGGHAELQGALRRLVARARALRELRPDWDSYGAAAPSAMTLDFALLFAAQTCVFLVQGGMPLLEPFMVATTDGGIRLEGSDHSRHIEIEIPQPGSFLVLAVERDQEDERPVTAEVAFRYDHVVGILDDDQAETRGFGRRFRGLEDVLAEEFDAAVEALHELELLRLRVHLVVTIHKCRHRRLWLSRRLISPRKRCTPNESIPSDAIRSRSMAGAVKNRDSLR